METRELVIDPAPVAEALAWPERAAAVVIQTPEHYGLAAELLKGIKSLRARIAETFDPHITRAHQAHKALVAEKAAAETPLTDAERVIKTKLVAYDTEQDRIRRAEEARLREAARVAEETRRVEEAAALERLAKATGDESIQAEAEAIIAAPIEAPVVTVTKATPVVAGISYRETWAAVVTNKAALVAFVAAHPDYLNLIDVNQTAVNGLARSLKGAMKIPGIQAQTTKSVAAGGRS